MNVTEVVKFFFNAVQPNKQNSSIVVSPQSCRVISY